MAELSLVVKATVVLAIGLAAARGARRSSAAVRALIITTTFARIQRHDDTRTEDAAGHWNVDLVRDQAGRGSQAGPASRNGARAAS